MKLYLTNNEKKQLLLNETLEVERVCYIPAPKNSIIHGIGYGGIFDKVDYRWVYGNTADYIKKMKNAGRRKQDYPNNTKNINSGAHWYEFPNRVEDEFGLLGDRIKNGRTNVINFRIADIYISELRPQSKNEYKQIVLKIKVVIIEHYDNVSKGSYT